LRAQGSGEGVILEAFKPGTAPPSTYSIIGYQDQMGVPQTISPEADRAVATGTGRPLLNTLRTVWGARTGFRALGLE
jgi:hypothetical protein